MTDGIQIENRTFDEIAVGDRASLARTITAHDIASFAAISGDVNPTHLNPEYAAADGLGDVVAHGMLSAVLLSTVLGTKLPGPGTVYVGQELTFLKPVRIGDTITATLTAKEKQEQGHRVVFDCACINQSGEAVTTGIATVAAPTRKARVVLAELPQLVMQTHDFVRADDARHRPYPARGLRRRPSLQRGCLAGCRRRRRAGDRHAGARGPAWPSCARSPKAPGSTSRASS